MYFNFRVQSSSNTQQRNIPVFVPEGIVTHLRNNINNLVQHNPNVSDSPSTTKRKREDGDENDEESDKKKSGQQQYTPFFEPTTMIVPETTSIQDSLARKLLDDILSLSYGGNYKDLFSGIHSSLLLDDSLVQVFLKHDSLSILEGIALNQTLTPLETLFLLKLIAICLKFPEGNKDFAKLPNLIKWLVKTISENNSWLQKEGLGCLIIFTSSFHGGVDVICKGFEEVSNSNRFKRLVEILGDENCIDFDLKVKIIELIDVMFTEAYESEEKLESVQKDFVELELGQTLKNLPQRIDDELDAIIQAFYESWNKFE